MDDSEKNEIRSKDHRPKGRLRAGPVRIDRVFVVSLAAHAILIGWLGFRLLTTEGEVTEETPLRWNSEVSQIQDSPQPFVPEQVDPPEQHEEFDGPDPQVIAEPLESAPWLRPQKTEAQPNLLSPEESASTRKPGLSAKYRADVETKVIKPETAPASSPGKDVRTVPTPKIAIFIAARKKPGACKRPPFPKRALRRRLSGKVTFLVDVGLKGEVLSLQLEKSSGHDVLDRAAKSAIAGWAFIPATRDGNAVRDRVRVPMRFQSPK